MVLENRYRALDDAICDHFRRDMGHPTNSSRLEQMARQVMVESGRPNAVAWRLIDRRIQAMKKAGRLRFERPPEGGKKVWQVSP